MNRIITLNEISMTNVIEEQRLFQISVVGKYMISMGARVMQEGEEKQKARFPNPKNHQCLGKSRTSNLKDTNDETLPVRKEHLEIDGVRFLMDSRFIPNSEMAGERKAERNSSMQQQVNKCFYIWDPMRTVTVCDSLFETPVTMEMGGVDWSYSSWVSPAGK
ncbi:hypothetical protein V6N13_120836 [Hibiscus sabdariffa]